MKNRFLLLIVAFAITVPSFARAELLFYRGLFKTGLRGDQADARQLAKVFVVIDRQNGAIAKLNYFAATGRLKLFTVEDLAGVQESQIATGRGETNSVLALAQTTFVDTNTPPTITSVFTEGIQRRLTTKNGATILFPRYLNWSEKGVAPSSITGALVTWEETGQLTFDTAMTITSNARGETLAAAEERLRSSLQVQGYREAVLR